MNQLGCASLKGQESEYHRFSLEFPSKKSKLHASYNLVSWSYRAIKGWFVRKFRWYTSPSWIGRSLWTQTPWSNMKWLYPMWNSKHHVINLQKNPGNLHGNWREKTSPFYLSIGFSHGCLSHLPKKASNVATKSDLVALQPSPTIQHNHGIVIILMVFTMKKQWIACGYVKSPEVILIHFGMPAFYGYISRIFRGIPTKMAET